VLDFYNLRGRVNNERGPFFMEDYSLFKNYVMFLGRKIVLWGQKEIVGEVLSEEGFGISRVDDCGWTDVWWRFGEVLC
jgi:hypothetical protein